jgi:hypothetical protein
MIFTLWAWLDSAGRPAVPTVCAGEFPTDAQGHRLSNPGVMVLRLDVADAEEAFREFREWLASRPHAPCSPTGRPS